MASNRWVKTHAVESIFEMDLLKAALDKESVEYVVKEHKETAYDGLFILQKGYASFFVREKDEAQVRTIVEHLARMPYVVSPED